MTDLRGHRVIVTGGSSGIGESTAALLRTQGAVVATVDRREGSDFRADVTDPNAVGQVFAEASASMGGLTDVFNNAGVGSLKRLHDCSDVDFDRIVKVNFYGTFHCIRAAVPLLIEGGGGSIVNMASVSGIRPTFGEGPYSAAKAAVIALTQSAALEYGPEIRVNCVSPGFVVTPLNESLLDDDRVEAELSAGTPLGRPGVAAEVATVVAFLMADGGSYITGQNIVIDGGSTLTNPQVDPLLRRLLGD